jgi:hypothetical protein
VVRPISDLRFMRHQLKANRSELYDVLLGNACFRGNCGAVYVGPVAAIQIGQDPLTLHHPDYGVMSGNGAVSQHDVVARVPTNRHGLAPRQSEAADRVVGLVEERQGNLTASRAHHQRIAAHHDHDPPQEHEQDRGDQQPGAQQEPIVGDREGDIGNHRASPGVRLLGGRAVAEDLRAEISEGDVVTGFNTLRSNAASIDPGSVRAVQVNYSHAIALEFNPRVLSRDFA